MKPQDILFFITLAILIWKHNPKWLVVAGLFCLLVSIPLFHFWIFFTAERLVWYASAFLMIAIIIHLIDRKK